MIHSNINRSTNCKRSISCTSSIPAICSKFAQSWRIALLSILYGWQALELICGSVHLAGKTGITHVVIDGLAGLTYIETHTNSLISVCDLTSKSRSTLSGVWIAGNGVAGIACSHILSPGWNIIGELSACLIEVISWRWDLGIAISVSLITGLESNSVYRAKIVSANLAIWVVILSNCCTIPACTLLSIWHKQ